MSVKQKDIKAAIAEKIARCRLFYVCRDAERGAAGLSLCLPNFFALTNDGPYARELKRRYPKNIILVKSKEILDTREIINKISNQKTGREPAIAQIKNHGLVVVFKPTKQIEKICQKNGWKLLNPPSALADRVEEKISQVKWLGPLEKYLPPHKVDLLKNIKFPGAPFILQFNRAHTGGGTFLIKNKKEMDEFKNKFPQREARVTKFISGPMFTSNNVVWKNKTLTGNISYQITGLPPFTDNPFATVGNDWALSDKILSPAQKKKYLTIAAAVGRKLAASGWRGLFGVDVILDDKTGKLHLIEINARQPASATYESELQHHCHPRENGDPAIGHLDSRLRGNDKLCTTFEAHLASLLDVETNGYELIKINDGAQIVKRVISAQGGLASGGNNEKLTINNEQLTKRGIKVIRYNNSTSGSDLFRIQSRTGMMKGHNKFNQLGELIKSSLKILNS